MQISGVDCWVETEQKQISQKHGHEAQIYNINFDRFAELFKPSNRLKDRGSELRKTKSISGKRHRLQIQEKYRGGHP